MIQSLSYYLTLFVLKLKGIKKTFSIDPIDVQKIRKEDVHYPKASFFKKQTVRSFSISDSLITEVQQAQKSRKLLIFIHGGAFISGPAQHHWDSLKGIHKQTNHTIWMCDYPKAPENTITSLSNNIDEVFKTALEQYEPSQIILFGDSVGGTLITALIQRLVENKSLLPKKIILVSPVMDATLSNPQIDALDPIDPMLSKKGVLSAKKMCAEKNDLKDPKISPLYGSFQNFPHTVLFLASKDITYPDQVLAVAKLRKNKTPLAIIEGSNMPHIWPLLPVMKEAKTALKELINHINN